MVAHNLFCADVLTEIFLILKNTKKASKLDLVIDLEHFEDGDQANFGAQKEKLVTNW